MWLIECAKMKKFKGIITLISLAVLFRVLASVFIGTTVVTQAKYETEFYSLFHTKPTSLAAERSMEYCNAPGSSITGLEGIPPQPNLMLLGAVLLVRHGDRLPISRPPAFEKYPVMQTKPCHLEPSSHPRHTLLDNYIKNVSYYAASIKAAFSTEMPDFDHLPDTCSDVSVTQTGIVQLLELGQYLGKKYMSNNLNPKKKHQEVAITTSRFARTFQSLLALLYGLSPSKFSELLSNSIGSSSSLYFCDSDLPRDPAYTGNCSCQKAKQIAKLRATFRDWDKSIPSIAELHKVLKIDENSIRNSLTSLVQISKIGPPPLSIASPSRIWDWLMSEYYCPGLDLPCVPNKSGKPYCLNSSVVDDLVRLVDKNHLRMISDEDYVKATSLAMYPFLNSVNEKFHELVRNAGITGQDSYQHLPFLWVISAHDITIGPLCIALDIPLMRKARYATRVVFELWTERKTRMKPMVRILFNGKDVTSQIRLCGTMTQHNSWKSDTVNQQIKTKHDELCPLSLFNHFVKSGFFRKYNNTDFETACQL